MLTVLRQLKNDEKHRSCNREKTGFLLKTRHFKSVQKAVITKLHARPSEIHFFDANTQHSSTL